MYSLRRLSVQCSILGSLRLSHTSIFDWEGSVIGYKKLRWVSHSENECIFSPAVFPWLMSPLIFIHRSPPMLGGYLRVFSPHWGVHSLLSGLRIATAFMQGSTGRLQYSSLSVEYVLTRTPGVANTGGFYTQHQDCSFFYTKLQVFVDALLTHIVLVLGPYYDIYTAL